MEETGPPDVKQAIAPFNRMQRQVSDEMKRRDSTLAAISHDIRTPLTALRVKTELIEDEDVRADHIASIEKMERITASALDSLRGESRNEVMRTVDLGELVDSVCVDFQDQGADIRFDYPKGVYLRCRSNALTRAVTNLLDNAVRYAGSAEVSIIQEKQVIIIVVADVGPGIASEDVDIVSAPFKRLSPARGANKGGFGLGLAIAKAVAEGHDGKLVLDANIPTGLLVRLELPR